LNNHCFSKIATKLTPKKGGESTLRNFPSKGLKSSRGDIVHINGSGGLGA